MDRKSIIVIALCFGLLLLWNPLVNKLFPPKPLPPGATNDVAQAQAVVATQATATATSPAPTTPAATIPQPAFPTNVGEQTIVITNDNARYTFTSHGGGLKLVQLAHYPEKVMRRRANQPLTNGVATLNTTAAAPVLSSLGGASIQGDGVFALTRTTSGVGVRAEKTLTNGLRVVKEFQITTNYLILATARLENTSGQPLALPEQSWVVGTATPMGPDDDGTSVGLMWSDGSKKQEVTKAWFENRGFMCTAGVPRPEYRMGMSNVVWAAMHNQFFALVAMPREPAQQVVSIPIDLPRPSEDEIPPNRRNAPPPKGFVTSFAYPPATLAPGQSLDRQIHFFAGPKEYQTLARIADRFQNNVDSVMGFDSIFPFYKVGGFFAKALLLGMNWFHSALKLPYGWAIIAITVLIKILFWPLTAASTRSMKRMQALQPQMTALKEKYKDDPTKMNRKLMEFMKENKVSPLGGCLPMALQMPVFFGFFSMIRSAIELRGASWVWVADLSKPDTLFMIPGLNFPFNPLPLLMGATMLWQARLTPPSPGMDPMQQKMMKYMPLMFLVFLYNYSAALALYWTVQNLLSIAQTKLTRTLQSPAPAAPSVLTPPQKKKK